MASAAERAKIRIATAKIEALKQHALNLSDEEKAMIFKEATRGSDPSNLSPEYQKLIIQMFLNTVIEKGSLSIEDICRNSDTSAVTYYKLMQGKFGPAVRSWLEEMSKTILSIGILPLMLQAQNQAENGSGKHLEIVLDYLGLLDGKEQKGSVAIQFVDKFIKQDGGGFKSATIETKTITMQKPISEKSESIG